MTIRPGDFWVADIPYTDGSGTKKRPVLVLWLDGMDAVVAVVTSAASRTVTDVTILDWRISGLRIPSTVRLSRLDCFGEILFGNRLGRVTSDEAIRLKAAWQSHIGLQF